MSDFSAIAWREQATFWWDGDDDDDNNVRFILDQHAELDFNSDCLLKQQSTCRHVAPLLNNSPHVDMLLHS